MDNKDLLAQNLEEKTDDTVENISPIKKRTTRKKTDSQKTSDAQKEEILKLNTNMDCHDIETENETKTADVEEISTSQSKDITDLPILTVSSSEFSSEVSNVKAEEEINETNVVDFIPTPDEIFATMQNSDKSPTESIEEEYTEPEPEFDVTDDDGQYTLTDIEPYKPEPSGKSADEASQKKYNPLKPRRIDRFFDFVELVVFTLLAVMIVTSFLFRHSIVDGESMENTLHSHEHLIISDLFYTPKRGDIIVCEDYTTAIPKPIVKRVIAIEGDTVKITSDGDVFVNGALIDESKYVHIDELGYKYRELEVTVPKNELFVMGDHRNKSTDSREIGTVSEDSVLGKVLLRFYPFNKFGKVD